MLKKLLYIAILGLFLGSFSSYSQFNVIKVNAINNMNPQIVNPFETSYFSSGASYERCISDHVSAEILVLYARALLTDTDRKPIQTTGIGVALGLRYYFQTSPEMLTYAPYGWYVSPTIGYTTVSGDRRFYNAVAVEENGEVVNEISVEDVSKRFGNKLNYAHVGAMAGYQFIMEEFQQGFTVDLGLGFNYLIYKDGTNRGTGDVNKINNFVPKIHFGVGFAF